MSKRKIHSPNTVSHDEWEKTELRNLKLLVLTRRVIDLAIDDIRLHDKRVDQLCLMDAIEIEQLLVESWSNCSGSIGGILRLHPQWKEQFESAVADSELAFR